MPAALGDAVIPCAAMTTTKPVQRGLIAVLLLASAAASAQTKIVPTASLPEAKGSADVRGIVRLGIRNVSGATVPAGVTEGSAGPGELLLVSGSNFGKKPEVIVAGQKVEALARTADGGVVVRVPPATPIGDRQVVVKGDNGDPSSRGMSFKHYALVSIPKEKTVHVVEVGESSMRRAEKVAADNPEDLRFSSDSTAGYILNGKKGGEWTVIGVDVTLPTPVAKGVLLKRTSDVSAFLTARRAPVMVIIDASGIDVFDTTDALAPKKVGGSPLPNALTDMKVQTAEISPDGKTIAVLGTTKNRMLVLRIGAGGKVEAAGPPVDALAGATTEHAVRAVRFSPDGKTAWVVSGDNPLLALQQKKELTRLTSVAIPDTGPPVAGKIRALKGAKAPRDFVVTWGRERDGNFEPTPPEDVAMVLAATPDKLFAINPKDFADPAGRRYLLRQIGKEANPGLLYRMNDKGGEPVGLRMAVILLDVEVTSDTSRVVCFGLNTRAEGEDVEFEVGVASAPAQTRSKEGILQTGFIALTKIKPEELKTPFRYGEVRIQP